MISGSVACVISYTLISFKNPNLRFIISYCFACEKIHLWSKCCSTCFKRSKSWIDINDLIRRFYLLLAKSQYAKKSRSTTPKFLLSHSNEIKLNALKKLENLLLSVCCNGA